MPLELDARQRAMLQEMGVRVWLPKPSAAPIPAAQPSPVRATAAMPASAPTPEPVAPPQLPVLGPLAQAANVSVLAAQAQACQACQLSAGRTRSTLSAHRWTQGGESVQADWFVVGDPPDADEDREGRPFVGPAGQLLDAMLKAVGADRQGQGAQGAYLSNIVKCHPQSGQVPQSEEWAQCSGFLRQELALVRPKVVLAMGRMAAQALLLEHPVEAQWPLGKQRGMVYRFAGLPVVVTYHPKMLLRAGADKAKAWADLCLALDVVGNR